MVFPRALQPHSTPRRFANARLGNQLHAVVVGDILRQEENSRLILWPPDALMYPELAPVRVNANKIEAASGEPTIGVDFDL